VGATQARRHREEAEWDAVHPEQPDSELYREQVMPTLAYVPVSRLAKVTRLSLAYCARIKRGESVPHPRWWDVLAEFAGGTYRVVLEAVSSVHASDPPPAPQLSLLRVA
jgi:hypothetical protein